MGKTQLLVDGQVFQSDAWDRGMGKYSYNLIKAFFGHPSNKYEKITIILSSESELIDDTRLALLAMGEGFEIKFLKLRVPKDRCQKDLAHLEIHNKSVLKKHIEEEYGEATVDFLIPSLFIDHTCSVFPDNADKKIIISYDQIPLLYSERYSKHCTFTGYLARYKTLFAADVVWTISQTVADDMVRYLGYNSERLINIDGAPIERHSVISKKVPLPFKRFILMTSGDDLRKNNVRAVQGFEEFRKKNEEFADLHLVITSRFTDQSKNELKAYSDHLSFVGNVTDAELRWLYETNECVLFVPEYEGLGLPVLEAVEFDRPVVCSDIGVFKEISERAFYYADPLDPVSIQEGIDSAVKKLNWSKKHTHYKDITKRYTWANSADRALKAVDYDSTVVNKTNSKDYKTTKKKKIAVFLPDPASYSAIGKVGMLTHYSLAEHFDVDYYIEKATSEYSDKIERADFLKNIANVYPAHIFNSRLYKNYDSVIYHIGNSEFHQETVKNALYLPGIAIIHDTHLGGLFNGPLLEQGYISRDRLLAEEKLDNMIDKNRYTSYLGTIVNNQKAVVVHSKYALKAIKNIIRTDAKVFKLNLPVPSTLLNIPKNKKSRLAVGLAGILHQVKGMELIDEFANDVSLSEIDIHVFGFSMIDESAINRLEGYPNVHLTINPTDLKFQTLMSRLDVLVNYRTDYRGETSLTALEAMSNGVVPIVRNIGWYSEIPDNCTIKVEHPNEIGGRLLDLAGDRQALEQKRLNAYDYIESEHSYASYAVSLKTIVDGTI